MTIPHSKPTLTAKEIAAVDRAIRSGQLAQGSNVVEFEKRFAAFHKIKFAVAVNSGTTALQLALLALGVGCGDEVIVPSFVCTALLNAVYFTGATPKIVDVNGDDFNISLLDTRAGISSKTKAIIVPHMFGNPIDVRPFLKWGIPVIEDCAQSIGATIDGKRVGTFGLISVFSFYATKMMTTGGEGGMAVTNSRNLADFIRDRRDYDNKMDYGLRFNAKMTEMAAAMGLVQFSRLSSMIAKRRRIAQNYTKQLSSDQIKLPRSDDRVKPVYFRYIVRVKNALRVIREMKKRGIDTEHPVFKPLHQYLYSQPSCPTADQLMKECVSLPIYPSLTRKNQKSIVDTLRKVLV